MNHNPQSILLFQGNGRFGRKTHPLLQHPLTPQAGYRTPEDSSERSSALGHSFQPAALKLLAVRENGRALPVDPVLPETPSVLSPYVIVENMGKILVVKWSS
jgi:hypothetical protein